MWKNSSFVFFGTSGHFLNGYFARRRVGTLIVDYIINILYHNIIKIYGIMLQNWDKSIFGVGDRKYLIHIQNLYFLDIYPKFFDTKRPHPEKLGTAIVFSKSFPGLGKLLQLEHIPSREPTYPTLEKDTHRLEKDMLVPEGYHLFIYHLFMSIDPLGSQTPARDKHPVVHHWLHLVGFVL